MSDGALPSEHEQFRRNISELTDFIVDNLTPVAVALQNGNVIGPGSTRKATNDNKDAYDRAAKLTQELRDAIKLDRTKFADIGNILLELEDLKPHYYKIQEIFEM